MSDKCKSTSCSAIQVKNPWKTISDEEKLEVICRHEEGERIVYICHNVRPARGSIRTVCENGNDRINPLNAELNPICYLLALLAHHFLHVSRIRVKSLIIRILMSYIYGAPILYRRSIYIYDISSLRVNVV